jgi:hypothetical protein
LQDWSVRPSELWETVVWEKGVRDFDFLVIVKIYDFKKSNLITHRARDFVLKK